MDELPFKLESHLKLSLNQKRLWIMYQQDKTNPSYNIQLTYHFNGRVDYNILSKSLVLLFNRHYTIFSVFRQENENPYIEIVPRNVDLDLKDFSDLPVEIRKNKIYSFASHDSRISFDLGNGPLYRLYLIKEDTESYYFHATIHHIIFDGWSRRIFVQELSRIYNDLLLNENVELEPLTYQSYDYVEQEANSMDSKLENELAQFWKINLKECPTEVKLPYDFPRKPFPSGLGRRESFGFSKECTSKLKEIGNNEGTSLFNVVVSLLGVLIHKYSNESDICIGVPVSNRRDFPLCDKIFGLFINTTVVRLQINTKSSFTEYLKYSKDIVRNGILNSKLPFEEIVKAVKPERIPGVNPLFQVSLSWLTDQTIPMTFGSIKGERTSLPEGISPFDLTFYMWEDQNAIKGDIEYNIDVFDSYTVQRIKDSFTLLAKSISDCPNKNLSDISAISETERGKINSFNNTELPIPDCLIQDFYETQAAIQPSRKAVISEEVSLTYKELDDMSNQLARHLLSLGIKSGDTVGICIDRSVEMVVSVLGVLKSGGCYLPMDPSFPDDRLSYMFEDSGAKVLISEKSLKDRFQQLPNTRTILIDTDKEEIRRNSTAKPELYITNQSPAYIIYTSGSTGKPKGVIVHHKSVVNLIESMSIKPGIKANDTLLAVVTLSFDMSVYELFVTLSKGATLVIAGSKDITNGPVLIELIEKHDITIIQGTPSFWSILLSAGWHGKKDLKSLCGGEALTYSLIRQILPKVGEFWNCYGPTEATVYATCTQISDENAPIVIGKPIHNTTIHILDKENNMLPIGVTGDVAIGGICVAKGYHNRPDLTEEKFIRIENGRVVYRTGDLGRFNNDGNVELFGRADNQIKLRGFRVEPGEIETLLAKIKGVRESVVSLHRFDENDERLVAFLNTDNDFRLEDEEIKVSLSQHLPPYMIPSYFQRSDGFPRLPNGKINKRALIFDLQRSDSKQQIDYNSLTGTQKELLNIWISILKTHPINLHDNFFNSGGNSLLGIRLINKIQEQLNVTLTFRQLILNSSVGQLSSYIDSQMSVKKDAIELVHISDTRNLPLTKNQKRLWLLSKLHPDIPLYIIRSTYRFNGSLNVEIFERSLEKLFRRHHIVFSVIKEVDGEPYCDIEERDIDLSLIDYTDLPETEKFEKVKGFINEDSKKGFDLERGPLYRMYLVKTAINEYYFHISIHHVIFDGWSQGVFIKDLNEFYNGLLRGEDVELEVVRYQQYDYAYWESDKAENEESSAFWKENLLECLPVLNFPYDFPRSEETTGKGGLEPIKIPKKLSNDLRRISKEEDTSLFITLLSVYGVLMKKYSGEDDINIGLPVAYRPHIELERIFGMFVNTVVVRLRYEKDKTFRELIKAADNAAMDAITHQDIPFESIVEIVNPERVSGANPLFQVAFIWQNNLNEPVLLDGIKSEVIKGDHRAATFDLSLALWENGDIIEGEIEYNMDIIKPETIKRLKEHLLILLNRLTISIDLPVNSVSIVSENEIRMIREINNTSTDYPKEKTIVQLFEDQAKKLPDHVAISFKGSSLTYKELNEKGNQLARTLRASGVSENIPVGLFSDKSLEMVVGMLGILKAGGCYVPVDPEYPLQRIDFIVQDSGIKNILIQDKYMGIEIKGVQKHNLNSKGIYNTDNSNIQKINRPEDIAYILYTSGTTGIPKGTPIRHRSVIRTLCNTNWISINPEDRVLQQAPIVFDMSTAEIWGPLLNGGALYIIDKETLLNPDSLGEEMLKNEITIFIITPAIFTHLLESRPAIFRKLKYMAMGGDVLPVAHINKVRKVNPDLTVINGYGPTENTCVSVIYKVEKDFDKSIPIGRPNSNSTAYIFDKYMNYQPIGVIGELYVGGDGLSPGYLNREDLNKVAFIENPHNPGEQLYKTGDLVRWLPDWNIEFRGRADNQLKIRGFRVELGEIESVLAEIEGVIEVVIKPLKVDEGDYKLIAFLNVPENFKMETTEILLQIRKKLPVYMIPSAFKYMHGFPKTVNGKTDRKALVFDRGEFKNRRSIDVNSLTPTEREVYKIWIDILKTDDISLADSFFDIGGNSLIGLRLINILGEKFGITLTFKELVTNITISQLAEILDSRTEISNNGINLVHLTDTTHLPLTSNQTRLWLISQLQPGIPAYIIPITYRFHGLLNHEIFERSLRILFERHHIVFSVIREEAGVPYCEIVPRELKVSIIDYTKTSREERKEKVWQLINEDSKQAFDLGSGPLYRLFLIKTAEDECYFHMSIHHIIFDGWSHGVLVNDLTKIYNSLLNEEEIRLEELDYQQYDYAQWETNSEAKKESIAFWEENLRGCTSVLNFPYDFQRKEQPTGKADFEMIRFSRTLSDNVSRISKEEGVSLFTSMLSAFGVLLHKYSGEDDLNIGLPVAYRPHSGLEHIFGMFVNTVVVRLRYDRNDTFRDLIRRTNDAALNAISHQEISFDTIVEIVKPERISNTNPLFQIGFEWQNNLRAPLKLKGIRSEAVKGDTGVANFDITLALWEDGDNIDGELHYSLDILKRDSVIRLKESFIHLLESLVSQPDKIISEVSLVSENDKKRLEAFNNTKVFAPDCLVQELFESQVEVNATKIAVMSGDIGLSYRDLDEKSNQMAKHLLSHGVLDGDVIGICLERSVEMVISVLGVLKAGCCYLPMDPMFPDERIAYMYKDSGAKVLISQSSLSEKFHHFPDTKVVLTDTDSSKISKCSTVKPELKIDSQSLAYIIYTSGSTGKPKGVEVHHQAVVNFLQSMAKKPGILCKDRLLAVTTLSFDISVLEVFLPLSIGAELIISGTEDIFDGNKLSRLLEEKDITFMQATPATWNILLGTGWKGKKNLKALCGGEAILPGLVKDLLPKVESLWDMYGPTETTVWSTCCQLTDPTPPILVGTPIDNTTVHILDKNNKTLPIGVIGEVAIGGIGVSKGYHKRPDLTAEKFITFEDGCLIYKTGDRGRFLDDGNLELLGRIDNQIKLRGFRIEPGEIESLLSSLPKVKEAIVKVQKFGENDERLVAFLNIETGFTFTKEQINDYLSRHLPGYMIPSFLQISEGFPRLPNGKINKKELVIEITEQEQEMDSDIVSFTPTQQKLRTLWSQTLKTQNISLKDNFFEIGGNSLLAIRLINLVREEYGLLMTFGDFLANSTIMQMTVLIDSQPGVKQEVIKLEHLTRSYRLPLTNNQKRLWLISQLQPGVPAYIIPLTYKLKGSLDCKIFEKSLGKLFERHHIVFSSIGEEGGEPYCDIIPRDVKVTYQDYSGGIIEEIIKKVTDIIIDDSRQAFDLSHGPLYRLYLVKVAEDEYYFHMSIHHIVFDGWSHAVFVNDLSKIYNSLIKGEEVNLTELEYQQYDYAEWETKTELKEESVTFWEENLSGCSSIMNFPFDFQRTELKSGRAGLLSVRLKRTLSKALKQISKEESSSLFSTLMGAFGVLMHKYTRESDLNIGLPVAYRPHTKLENIFGMFVNTVVVRLKYEKGDTFRDLIKRTNEAALNAISHQDVPFETIVERTKPERITGTNPLFQVALAWQNNLSVPINLDGVVGEVVRSDEGVAVFDITLALWENGDNIEGLIEYKKDLLKPETVKRLRDHFLTLLENLIEDIDGPVNNVPMISEEELQMIYDINKTKTNYPKDKTIAELFENNARLFPDKIAVAFKGESYSYKQLNEKSNQLARTLRKSGVGKNTPVGLFTDKSLEMIVGVMGILKAGGCFTPIDPEYPEQRISFIVEDAGIKSLLIQDKYMGTAIEGVQKLNLDMEEIYDQDKSNLQILNGPEDYAYILYTSGTTGLPKGTPIPQRGAIRLVCNTNYFRLSPDDRVQLSGALVFDASMMEIWGALLNGGSLYIIDKQTLLSPYAFGEELLKNKITFLVLTAALFTHLVESRSHIFGKIKCLVVGGDVLSTSHANKVRKDNPNLILINGYGPTENSTQSTYYVVNRDFESNIPIGKPNSNSTVYIFDGDMNYQPIGVVGELYVGGDGLSTGYLNKEDLNKVCFINNPHNPGERLYKTGDLARWLPDGNIEFRGRADNQLKIRGFRVELEEIESVLSEIEGVIEAIIKPIKVEEGDYRLVAFLNVPENFTKEKNEVFRQIKSKLPVYMIPSAIKYLNGFPRTINGKIDRKALVFDTKELGKKSSIDINTLKPLEREIHKIWSDILKTEDFSLTDSFFEIGGTSLLGLRLINLIREKYGFILSFKELTENATIDQLCTVIDTRTIVSRKVIDLTHLSESRNLPLTSNQKRLWIISRLQPDEPLYIISSTYRFSGSFNQEVFEQSIKILFRRHHVVFSVFKESEGEPYCDIVQTEIKISFCDYSGLADKEKLTKVKELVFSDSRKVFDLEHGPLFRLYLIRTSPQEHYFHLSIHHIIFDGWSHAIFTNELSGIYNSILKDETIELKELEYQQYDFAQWEANSEISKESIGFWEENLRGCSTVLNFPYDFQRKEQSTGKGGYIALQLPKELSDSLRNISREEGSSLFSTLMGAFGVQILKYTGENDLNIGLPVAYRPHSKLEQVFGMFVNTVVVRFKHENGDTFRDLIKRTNEGAMNAIAHQDLPFEKVVEIVKPDRASNTNPLFQVALAWQNNLNVPINLEGIICETIPAEERSSIFDIIIYLWEDGELIEGGIEYSGDLLKRETMIRFRDNLLDTINKLIENPDSAIESLPLITNEEKLLIDSFNETQTNYPKEKTIVQLFEEQVNLFPKKNALVFQENYLTYCELNEKANQLARTLKASGVKENIPVGILADKSLEMVIGILAILKAGGGYVPIDPEYPEHRIDHIINDSGCKILLLQNKYIKLKVEGVDIIDLDASDPYKHERTNIGQINSSSDLAYIMYTSGTTGKPKGTVICQKSIIRLIRNTNFIELTSEDRLLLTGAIVFDASTFEIWGMLLNGGTLFIVEKDLILDPEALGNELINNGITVLWLTSALFTQIAEQRTDIFSNLKYLLVGGDVLSAPHINKVRNENPNLKVINGYGPTENTTFSTTYLIEKDFESNIPIGKPISNSTAHVFDKYLNYQPIGVIGELYVGGDGLSTGYLNREDLNRTSFIDNPHHPGERLYKTGDLARWLPDGNIEFHGRIDNQLKIRGFRVEMEEIESVLSEIEGVIETVVKPVKVDEGDIRLVAFLNVKGTFKIEISEILAQIRKKLPAYMVPSAFKLMNGFPKTINGKTDKKALTFEISELSSKPEQDKGDFTPTEKIIHQIWSDILKTEGLSLTDSFFNSGGNSLSGLRLINLLREKFKIRLTFKELVSNETIEQLGAIIDTRTIGSEEVIELIHSTETQNLPLTRNQKRLWIISKLQPDKPLYIIPSTYRFVGMLNRKAFEKSFEILFQRHHIVFSVIKESEGKPYCNIIPTEVKIAFIDYTGLPEEEKLNKIKEHIHSDSRMVFDFEHGPLYRLYLIKTSADEYYFHLSIHHIIFDGWSFGVFASDLSNIYNSLIRGEPVELEPLEYQQYDYAKWEENKEVKQESVEFWEDYLNGCSSVLNFPYDFQRKGKSTGRGSFETLHLSKALSDSLRNLSKEVGTSLFNTLMSVFGMQLHKYSSENDLNIGLPVAFRPHSKLENIFGMFVNTIVVRFKYDKDFSFRELIKYSNDAAMNAIAHQDLPFERVVEIVNPDRTSNANPLFQVGFIWQNNLSVPLNLNGIMAEPVRGEEGAAIFDLTLTLWENDDVIEGEVDYNIDLLKRETVIRFRENYVHLLQSLVRNPDQKISELSIVSENDKKKLEEFNNTEVQIPECLIQELFEEQVLLHPGKIAVVSAASNLTYKELDEKANQIARQLRTIGADNNDVIGIYLERSAEMVISVLGVLKAGCCYLPLDPFFPEDRLRYMIEDSNTKVLISQKSLKDRVKNITLMPCLILEEDKDLIDRHSVEKPLIDINSKSPMYIIYTSGSTGKPKGVSVHHHAVVNLIKSMSISPGINEKDRLLAVVTLSFDMSVYELFITLSNGATLVVANNTDITDGRSLTDLIKKHDITILQATPSFWNILLSSGWQGKKNLKALCGGEALTASFVHQIVPKVGEFWNCYGPTETAVYSTYIHISDPESPILIGKPINNTRILILDSNNKILPIGVPGEVAIGGKGVSKGYINLPDLTSEKFIKFENEQVLYKTGDLGRYLSDGNVELLGRIDNQIKIRGFRVEPGEIETLLGRIKGVKESVVKIHKFADHDERLVAYLNVEKEFVMTRAEIVKSLSQYLPPYMIPAFFQEYYDFPRLPNGKINKKALQVEILQSPLTENKSERELSPIEKTIFDIWSEELKIKSISINDNFFDVGGNSLLAISVMSKIEASFNISLGLKVFFDSPQIEHLAEAIELAIKKPTSSESGKEKKKMHSKIVKGEL